VLDGSSCFCDSAKFIEDLMISYRIQFWKSSELNNGQDVMFSLKADGFENSFIAAGVIHG